MIIDLLKDFSPTGKGPWRGAGESAETLGLRSFQASVLGSSGAVTAVVKVWGANDLRFPILIGTVTLNGTLAATDAFADNFPFENYMAEVVTLTGTNATVSVAMKV